METKYMTSVNCDIKLIVEKFVLVEKELGIKDIDLTYFLFTLKLSKTRLYDAFHIMIEQNIIKQQDYSICDNCMNEEIVYTSLKLNKCNRCKKYYEQDHMIEKFRLVKS
ncbi:hypothetical protein H7E67_10445 [Clostridium gasigenes]|uniref:hypothetical protein n=1 Tax=Clostridium gasigenes TaxID=94869 RepID=UPI0016267714|nr:hypothetical protein [Clostridium gasigenes]MBB6623846.1 hypothetical protein [Clostridium gasigenes]